MPKADAKNQTLNTVCQKKPDKIKCQRNVNMIYQDYQHTESHERYKKNEREK